MKSLILQEAINYAILRGVLFVDLFQRPPHMQQAFLIIGCNSAFYILFQAIKGGQLPAFNCLKYYVSAHYITRSPDYRPSERRTIGVLLIFPSKRVLNGSTGWKENVEVGVESGASSSSEAAPSLVGSTRILWRGPL